MRDWGVLQKLHKCWREGGLIKRREKERISEQITCCHVSTPWGARGAHGSRGLPCPWGPRPPSRAGQVATRGLPTSRALPRFVAPYLEHPTSDFEFVFGLRTVTPSRTTTTTQLWKMVERSSRNLTMKSTQQMRTKSSIVNLFGLETLWMSNRNDRNTIRH